MLLGGTASHNETAASAVQQLLAKRAGFAFERLWGAVGSLLEVLETTTSSILKPITDLLAVVRSASVPVERGPPEEIPPLSSSTGVPVGNAMSGAGSSGGGIVPPLAVLALVAIVVARGGRFWVHYELPKPGFVPQLVPERPG